MAIFERTTRAPRCSIRLGRFACQDTAEISNVRSNVASVLIQDGETAPDDDGRDTVVDRVALVVSELLTNALTEEQRADRTSKTHLLLGRNTKNNIIIRVYGAAPELPPDSTERADLGAESGRGLDLTELFAVRVGCNALQNGQCVWAELPDVLTEVTAPDLSAFSDELLLAS